MKIEDRWRFYHLSWLMLQALTEFLFLAWQPCIFVAEDFA